MSAKTKLSNAVASIDDAERIIKRLKNAASDSDLESQLRKALRELDEAREFIERARREISNLER